MGTRVALLPLFAVCVFGQYSAKMSFGAPPEYGRAAVTGAPYSAEEVNERLQVLADGTRITQAMAPVKVFRDSQGRTRRERAMFIGPLESKTPASPVVIDIDDPVGQARYVLDTANKVAHRQELPPPGARPARISRPVPPATDVPRREVKSEDLGSQTIEGVVAEGRRHTATWPAGSQGNDRPITNSNETWFSEELKITILRKSVDPRTGEHTYRLKNISRVEPDPGLFRIPPDYTVVEEKGEFTIRWGSGH